MSALTGNQEIDVVAARTQRARVLAMLKKGMRFSQLDVEGAPYFIRRLASRVSELRALGFPIKSTRITQGGIAGMVQYSLTETAADIKNKRYLLQRLLTGEVLTAENVTEFDEMELDRLARWLRADGWPVLIVKHDGLDMTLYALAGGDGDGK